MEMSRVAMPISRKRPNIYGDDAGRGEVLGQSEMLRAISCASKAA